MQSSALCRSRRELSSAYFLAKFKTFASIQPRTSPVKFARSSRYDRGQRTRVPAGGAGAGDGLRDETAGRGGAGGLRGGKAVMARAARSVERGKREEGHPSSMASNLSSSSGIRNYCELLNGH